MSLIIILGQLCLGQVFDRWKFKIKSNHIFFSALALTKPSILLYFSPTSSKFCSRHWIQNHLLTIGLVHLQHAWRSIRVMWQDIVEDCIDAFDSWLVFFFGARTVHCNNEWFSSSTYHEPSWQLISSGWYLLSNYHAIPNLFQLFQIIV